MAIAKLFALNANPVKEKEKFTESYDFFLSYWRKTEAKLYDPVEL